MNPHCSPDPDVQVGPVVVVPARPGGDVGQAYGVRPSGARELAVGFRMLVAERMRCSRLGLLEFRRVFEEFGAEVLLPVVESCV